MFQKNLEGPSNKIMLKMFKSSKRKIGETAGKMGKQVGYTGSL